MRNLLTFSYWFNISPEPWLESSYRFLILVFGIMVIIGLLAGLFIKKNDSDNLKRKFWDKIQSLFLLIGFLGLGLVFCRQEEIGFLSMPFLLLLLGVWALIWAYKIFRYAVKIMPERREEQRKKEEKQKYL
ncbi:hypothetical protein GYA13_01940 [Candidatus Kuenenbacteria bacterium]|nr:hypothetical protein [Candidatus Kuenenbacteria bacterium]